MQRKTIYALGILFLLSCSNDPAEPSHTKPEESRFVQKVMVDGLQEPLQIEFDKSGYVYWIERGGRVKRFHEEEREVELLGKLELDVEPGPGLIGILLDRDFEKSRHIFLFFSAKEDNGEAMRLSRFMLDGANKIDMTSQKIMLIVPWEQPDGHHFGGGMTWDKDGNLYLSIGADSAPSQYSPLAFKNEGGRGEDDGRTAGNTNDLRGAIIRITPQPDGSYTIPEGNLFPIGTPRTLPEIYIMGNRNPWRVSIDSKTQFLHWGEVGPDAGVDSEAFGPMGYDEFNVAKSAGNYGWPYFVGNNKAYNRYDYQSGEYGKPYNPDSSYNDSPNNTGLKLLPSAKPALISYPYEVSREWPMLGSAARSAVGGPVFRKQDFDQNAGRVFPEYYEGKWFITDYVRNWIMVVSMDESRSQVIAIERFLPTDRLKHSQPLDMDFSPNGDLYLIEYGIGSQGEISRIEYNSGNRAPRAQAAADRYAGDIPMTINLSSKGSDDDDGDPLKYTWSILAPDGRYNEVLEGPNPGITLQQSGVYLVRLAVTDPEGLTASDTLRIVAGNRSPQVRIDITGGNRSFYFSDSTVRYSLRVDDPEDGSLEDGSIKQEDVSLSVQYIPSGIDFQQLATLEKEKRLSPEVKLRHLNAKALLVKNNCGSCHLEDKKLVGPSFKDISQRYAKDKNAIQVLSKSILEGGAGKWGEALMPPQVTLSNAEVVQLIDYILETGSGESQHVRMPTSGEYITKAYQKRSGGGRLDRFFRTPLEMGSYVFVAAYTDRGSKEKEGLNLSANDFALLRFPVLAPENADYFSDSGISYTPSTDDPGFIFTGQGGYIGFRDIDLSGINKIRIGAANRFWHWSHFVGATIEIRLGSPEGPLMGEPYIVPKAPEGEKGPFFGEAMGKPATFDASGTDGVHELFIVVKNNSAHETDALLIVTGIEFQK